MSTTWRAKRPLLAAVVVAVAFVASAACLSWSSGFDGWQLWGWQGWNALVAVGTLSLAGFTAWLGFATQRLATQTGAEVAAQFVPIIVELGDREDPSVRQAEYRGAGRFFTGGPSVRPTVWLALDDLPEDEHGDDELRPTTLHVRVLNAGHGPALRVVAVADFASVKSASEPATIAAGDTYEFIVDLEVGDVPKRLRRLEDDEPHGFQIRFTYEDTAGLAYGSEADAVFRRSGCRLQQVRFLGRVWS